jgi:hypothetical protein
MKPVHAYVRYHHGCSSAPPSHHHLIGRHPHDAEHSPLTVLMITGQASRCRSPHEEAWPHTRKPRTCHALSVRLRCSRAQRYPRSPATRHRLTMVHALVVLCAVPIWKQLVNFYYRTLLDHLAIIILMTMGKLLQIRMGLHTQLLEHRYSRGNAETDFCRILPPRMHTGLPR